MSIIGVTFQPDRIHKVTKMVINIIAFLIY